MTETALDYTKPNECMHTIANMPIEQQDAFLAQWMMAVIDDLRFRALPAQPHEVKEFESYTNAIKYAMRSDPDGNKKFWQNPQVKYYFDQKHHIENINLRNQWILVGLKKRYEHDQTKIDTINFYLNGFISDKDKVIEQPAWTD